MLRSSVAGVVPVLYRKFVLINLIYISGTIVGFNEKTIGWVGIQVSLTSEFLIVGSPIYPQDFSAGRDVFGFVSYY